MSGLYIVADLSALGEAAGHLGQGGAAEHGALGLPSFGHPGADASMSSFARSAQQHGEALAQAGQHGAEILRGYAVAFHRVGD